MTRITNANIQFVIDQINEALGVSKTDTRAFGNHHTYSAYGSIGLVKTSSASGGVVDVINLTTKRELYNSCRALLAGIEAAKNIK